MRMHWLTFLALGTLGAIGATSACTVDVVETPAAGAAGGSAGTGGANGDAATSDATTDDASGTDASGSDVLVADAIAEPMTSDATTEAGTSDILAPPEASSDAPDVSADALVDAVTGDSALDSPTDAGGDCFGEDQPDAGRATTCASLPYYTTVCPNDAGDLFPPAGATLCDALANDLKNSAYEALFACLAVLPGADGGADACSAAHEQASAECSRNLFNRTMCPVADGTVEGGLYGCTQIAASCGPDSGDGGVTVEQCRGWLGPFNAVARQDIIDCYLDPSVVGATSCRDKLENYCVFP
jgi:hypothetical protein